MMTGGTEVMITAFVLDNIWVVATKRSIVHGLGIGSGATNKKRLMQCNYNILVYFAVQSYGSILDIQCEILFHLSMT